MNALRREEVKDLSVGLYHVIVATKSEKVFAWGDGKFGRVGRPGVDTEEVIFDFVLYFDIEKGK